MNKYTFLFLNVKGEVVEVTITADDFASAFGALRIKYPNLAEADVLYEVETL